MNYEQKREALATEYVKIGWDRQDAVKFISSMYASEVDEEIAALRIE